MLTSSVAVTTAVTKPPQILIRISPTPDQRPAGIGGDGLGRAYPRSWERRAARRLDCSAVASLRDTDSVAGEVVVALVAARVYSTGWRCGGAVPRNLSRGGHSTLFAEVAGTTTRWTDPGQIHVVHRRFGCDRAEHAKHRFPSRAARRLPRAAGHSGVCALGKRKRTGALQ